MTDPISDTYSAEWFSGHVGHRAAYHAVADVILEHVAFDSVTDIGCGCGYILERMHERGKQDMVAIDASAHATAYMPQCVERRFVAATVEGLGSHTREVIQSDLVLCTEVAEHLPESQAYVLVNVLVAAARTTIAFTAATPNQGGHGHLNEQPHEYWLEKFAVRGWVLDEERTAKMRAEMMKAAESMPWFGRNFMLLVKA